MTAKSAPSRPLPDLPRDSQTDYPAPANGTVRSVMLIGLFLLALFFILHIARPFFLPVALAVLFNFLLTPVVRFLGRAHLSPPVAGAVVLLVSLGIMGLGMWQLAGPARDWMSRAPENLSRARDRLRGVARPVEEIRKSAERLQKASDGSSGETPTQMLAVQQPSITSRLFGTTQAFAIGLFEMLILLYFLLAAGPLFIHKVVKVLPRLSDKKKALEIAGDVEGAVSKYLFTVAAINVVEGAVVTVMMFLLGMPNPPLWGALAATLIFIPYIGATIMVAVLFLVAMTTFEGIGHALAVPSIFLAIDVLQAYLISPHVLGRKMELNPVAIFVSILLWGEVWGVPGVFMAVPIAVTLKTFCDHIEGLKPVGEFLGK
ncbi:MAG: AI-2E family transporter [Gemmatimonadetes bacterium]|nr:AI-2E family transporter [Gemmatimonadota bacterium]